MSIVLLAREVRWRVTGGRSDCWLLVVRVVEHAEPHGVLLFVLFVLLLYGLEGHVPVLLLLLRLFLVLWLLLL